MRRLILFALLLPFIASAQTPHGLATGTTSVSLTLANQTSGGTNFVYVSWCPSNCSSGSTANSPVTVTDSAGSAYTSVYRTDGAGANQVFIAPSPNSASNVITVSIPASDSSVVMASQIAGPWTLDTAANANDLIYAVFIGTDAPNYLAGTNYTRLNAGTWWTDEFSTTSLTPTFLHNGVTANPTFSVPFKPNPSTTPPVLDMITISIGGVKVCATACDGTDDTPETGTLIVTQQKLSQTFAFNSDGTISAQFGIDTSVDPADFTFSLTDATGSLEYKIPQAVLAGQTTIGTLALPPMRIQKTATGIAFKGFVAPTVSTTATFATLPDGPLNGVGPGGIDFGTGFWCVASGELKACADGQPQRSWTFPKTAIITSVVFSTTTAATTGLVITNAASVQVTVSAGAINQDTTAASPFNATTTTSVTIGAAPSTGSAPDLRFRSITYQ